MGLFSFSRKNKQEPASGDSEFYSRADEESTAVRSRSKRKDKQSNEPVDPVLPEKKRARRRLVGAIALVLAAVIGLPMIFDSEPKPFADDITIQIPSKDKSANKRNDTSQPVSPAASAISRTDASASLDPKEELVTPSSSAGVTTAAMVTAGAAATTAAVVTKVGNQPSASTKPTVVDKNADKVQVAEAKPEAKSEAKQTQKPNAKADSKTEPKTVAAVDQKSNDGSKAKDKAKEATANSDGSKAATDKNAGKFMLQVAALMTQEKINELQGKLKKAGFAISSQKVATESGVSTRIRVGPYGTKEEAEKARAKLVKMGLNGTLVSH